MTNPIKFNPDGMTVSQLKECADLVAMKYAEHLNDKN